MSRDFITKTRDVAGHSYKVMTKKAEANHGKIQLGVAGTLLVALVQLWFDHSDKKDAAVFQKQEAVLQTERYYGTQDQMSKLMVDVAKLDGKVSMLHASRTNFSEVTAVEIQPKDIQ